MSTQREAVSTGNFKSRVASVVRSGKSIRANIQELAMFALVFYLDPKNNGNTEYLTHLFNAVAGVKSLNSRTLGHYIEDTANVRLRKTDNGDFVFRKAVKGEEPALLDGADLTANWWDHGRGPSEKPVDVLKILETAIKTLEKTQGDAPKKELVANQSGAVQPCINTLREAARAVERVVRDAELSAAGMNVAPLSADADAA